MVRVTRDQIIDDYEKAGVRATVLSVLLEIAKNPHAKDRDRVAACRQLMWPFQNVIEEAEMGDALKVFLAKTSLKFRDAAETDAE